MGQELSELRVVMVAGGVKRLRGHVSTDSVCQTV